MDKILWILITILSLMMAYLIVAFVYTIIVTVKQDASFINNLKVGDITNCGEVLEVHEKYVVVKRSVDKSVIAPTKYLANKFLFLFKN